MIACACSWLGEWVQPLVTSLLAAATAPEGHMQHAAWLCYPGIRV